MENKEENLSTDTVNFILWYQELNIGMKDFASALMIANLTDVQLNLIKEKTIFNYPIYSEMIQQTN